jgi:DNA invertase Pin-like site-specific DNA recombinase
MKRSNDKRTAGQPIRCAIYTRKSTEHGLDLEFNSLDAQREACEAYVKSQASEGWQVIKEHYDDPAYSGGNMERPALKRLLKAIEAGLVDVVVVYKIDRLTRSLADFAKLVEAFDAKTISFVAVTQQFNTTTSMGRLTLNVLLSFAQFERELASERVKDKVAASRKKGKWMGGNVPLGYDAIDKKLVINPAEAKIVRMIFDRYLAVKSLQKVIDEMHANGIVSRRRYVKDKQTGGVPFTYGPLAYLLKNRTYLGESGHGGKWFAGEHDPIVDKKTFQAVQNLIKENSAGRSGKRYRNGALLTGVLYDDRGHRMSPSFSVKNGVRYPFYVSQALLKGRKTEAGAVARITASAIEATVLHTIGAADPDETPQSTNPRDLLESLIERMVITPDGITLTFADKRPPLHVQRQWKDAKNIYGPPHHARPDQADPKGQALIHSIVQAHRWVEMVLSGDVNDLDELAKQENVHPKIIRNRIRLAFLAPHVVSAMLEASSSQPQADRSNEFALKWSDQRERSSAIKESSNSSLSATTP